MKKNSVSLLAFVVVLLAFLGIVIYKKSYLSKSFLRRPPIFLHLHQDSPGQYTAYLLDTSLHGKQRYISKFTQVSPDLGKWLDKEPDFQVSTWSDYLAILDPNTGIYTASNFRNIIVYASVDKTTDLLVLNYKTK